MTGNDKERVIAGKIETGLRVNKGTTVESDKVLDLFARKGSVQRSPPLMNGWLLSVMRRTGFEAPFDARSLSKSELELEESE